MKKTFIALAVSAVAAGAAAQSSVTLWGVVDVDVGRYSLNGVKNTIASSSGNAPSQLGFRGSEDLGGGLSAGFWLEAGLLNDTGTGTAAGGGLQFGRRSTVGINGPWGEIRLGRENAPSFWNYVVFDPFASLGPGAATNITIGSAGNGISSANPLTGIYVSNAITYLYGYAPHGRAYVGRGFYGQVMYSLAENVGSAPAIGKYTGARAGYAAGPVNVALSYAASVGPAAYGNPVTTNLKEINLGGSYDFGMVRLLAHLGTNNADAAGAKFSHWGVGTTITVGQGYIPVSYNSTKQNNAAGSGASQLAGGYVYQLSKRTAVYTTVSRLTNKNGGTFSFRGGNGGGSPGLPGGGSGTGFDMGIRHSF